MFKSLYNVLNTNSIINELFKKFVLATFTNLMGYKFWCHFRKWTVDNKCVLLSDICVSL